MKKSENICTEDYKKKLGFKGFKNVENKLNSVMKRKRLLS